ncbi:hypothetical protein LXL04_003367 [Taraxacum kok-saghyz]
MKCKERTIRATACEANGGDVDNKTLVPCPGSLFEAIQCLTQATDMMRVMGAHVTRWLLHVDLFGEVTVKESIFDIQLMYRPVPRYRNGKNCAYRSGFDDRTKGVVKIQPWLLGKTLCHKATFVAVKFSMRVKLMAIKPQTTNDVGIGRRRNQIPCVIGVKSIHFRVHGSFPIRVARSLRCGTRDRRDIGDREIKDLTREGEGADGVGVGDEGAEGGVVEDGGTKGSVVFDLVRNEAVVKPVPKTVVKSVTKGDVKRKITYIANGTFAKRTRNSTLANKLKELPFDVFLEFTYVLVRFLLPVTFSGKNLYARCYVAVGREIRERETACIAVARRTAKNTNWGQGDPDNSFRALSAASFVAKRTKPNPYTVVKINRYGSFRREMDNG